MRVFFAFLLLALTTLPAAAQEVPDSPIATAQLLLHAPDIQAGESIHAAVMFTMPPEWHIYWQNPGDSGIATTLTWSLPEGITAGAIQWPTPERIEVTGIFNYGYSNRVILPVELTPARDAVAGTVTVKADWLVCKDICIPESATLTATLPASSPQAAALVAQARAQLPAVFTGTAEYEIAGEEVHLTFFADALSKNFSQESIVQWFPVEDGVIQNGADPRLTCEGSDMEETTCTLSFPRGSADAPAVWNGVLTLQPMPDDAVQSWQVAAPLSGTPVANGAAVTTPAAQSAPTAHLSLLLALVFAFIGGLILNAMPCVLPILSLKALALAKKSGAEQRHARAQGIAYAIGVIVSFLAIAGVMLALKSAGAAIGWGFQLQEPGFIAALFFLMLLVALNLFGLFEMPVLFGSTQTNPNSLRGSFLTGALAVALATPCSAPFMAPALGATLTLSTAATLLVFTALGLGMAAPFLLISIWPAARRILPKPGVWMLRFKQFLAFPMLATAAWLLWVLTQTTGSMGLMLALTAAVTIAWLVWWAHITPRAGLRKILLLALALVVVWGVASQPSPQSSAPPMGTDHVAFSAQTLAELRAAGTPVFVDATADWCLTCKINERVALRDSSVQQLFAEKKVTLMVADWTARDAAITEYLASFGRNGVPLYVYYPPGGEPVLLPQLLTPSIIRAALE